MTKDDDLPAASGGPPPRRALPGHARKTAPIGTPVQKFPLEIPSDAAPAPPPMPAKPARSERPPSSSQNTLSSPRTVGGHTARLLRGEPLDDDEPESIEPSRGARPRVQDRSARGRPLPLDEDDETLARGGANARPASAQAPETSRGGANARPAPAQPPEASRGGTLRMDGTDQPAGPAQAAIAAARKGPPAAAPPPTPPLSPDPISEDLPSTARGGSARDFNELPSQAARPVPGQIVAPPPLAPPPPVATPVVTSTPMGEITITGSEFEQTTIPREEIESRWPFAFAVGAVSLAIGSLLPLPFREYIVPDRSPAPAASPSPVSSAKVVATPDLLHTTAPPPQTATVAPPPSSVPKVGVGTTAPPFVRPPPFGSVKTPRPNPTTPRDIF